MRGGSLADERTLAAVDFPAVRAALAGECGGAMAAALARAVIPSTDPETVREAQAATTEMRALLAEAAFGFGGIPDCVPVVERAALRASLSGEELRAVHGALAAAAAAVRAVHEADAPRLHARARPHRPLPELVHEIGEALGERGEVLDRASPALARVRKAVLQAQAEARERTASVLRAQRYAKMIGESIVTVREGRYVVPIKAEFSGEFPGVVHDTSSSGATVFIEPLVTLEANNRLRALRIEEQREVERILQELSVRVGENSAAILGNLDVLAQLDLASAAARLADRYRAVAPQIVDEARIEIVEGRHPLLRGEPVAQSLRLDEEQRVVVISGPNMGGKTVTLKMVGLFLAMACCGLHVPAREGTVIGMFDGLYSDIGDEQSIAENLSTYSAHIVAMRGILERADARSLVIVDEIGGGTEPSAGAALAIAMLEVLLRRRTRAIVTTHATELKVWAHGVAHVRNASVRFDPRTHAPTYQLDVGSPGQSLAFPLARALGIAGALVDRAETLLAEGEREYDRAVSALAEERAILQGESTRLREERERLVSETQRLAQARERLEEERRRLRSEGGERLGRAIREFNEELARRAERGVARPRASAGQHRLLERTLAQIHQDLGIEHDDDAADAAQAGAAAVGDRVRLPAFDQSGTVIEDYGERLLVQIGTMKTVVARADVRLEERAARARAPGHAQERKAQAMAAAAAQAHVELDVRGMRVAEAEPLVEKWIDEAVLAGGKLLRLIHGKGTGMLGRGLQAYLQGHPQVQSFRYGNADEGGTGVTVIELS
ncbi:endonuclease MutS2 [bacterium]|nr:MAG: endonuclease MutS2 [bacterium]